MRVFTLIGPAQSGKTTLAAALAALDGRATRVSLHDAVTVTAFTYLGEDWAGLDIAGGPDALGFAGSCLAASDAAVLCVPPSVEGAVLSAPYLRLAEESGVPCFLFINRMDVATDRVRDIVAALQTYSGHHIVLRQVPIREGDAVVGSVDLISERAWRYREGEPSDLVELPQQVAVREAEARSDLLESLSDFDDALLEELIEDKRPSVEEVFHIATRVCEGSELISAFLGAASHNNGVTRLMKSLRHEAPGVDTCAARIGGDAVAVGVAADVRKHLGKFTVLRALEDLTTGDAIGGSSPGSLTEIDAKTPIKVLPRGALGLAIKSDHLEAARAYAREGAVDLPVWSQARPPMLSVTIVPVSERDDVRLTSALGKLVQTDPGVTVRQDPVTGQAILGVQGNVHLRRVTAKLAGDFGIDVTTAPVPPAFCETITRAVDVRHRHRKQSGGAGQFAEVAITVTPQARGSGFAFDEVVKGGAVPRNYIPSVGTGAEDALARGPLGFPVVDVSVTLTDGKHHSVDSSDFAFRTAGAAAMREALAQAGPVLLQPILRVDIRVPSVFAGGLVPTVSSLGGQVLGFEGDAGAAGWDVFSAMIPATVLDALVQAIAGATRGTAWADARFEHYEEVRGAEADRLLSGTAGAVPA